MHMLDFERLSTSFDGTEASLRWRIRNDSVSPCQGAIEATLYTTGVFDISSPCDSVPEVIRKITGCSCLELRTSLQRCLMEATQAAVYFGVSKIRRSYPQLYSQTISGEASPLWDAMVEYHRALATSFDRADLSERKELVASVELIQLIGLLEFSTEWNRELRIQAVRRLFRSFDVVLKDVVVSLLGRIHDETELFQEVHTIATRGVGKEADEANKALHRLAQNCELKLEQLESLLHIRVAHSRLVAGRWDVARKLIGCYPNLSQVSNLTLCKISDALLAAPNPEIGIEHQYRILHAANSPSMRTYVSENIARLRA